MGAVHPWAYKAIEECSLVLLIVWTIRTALGYEIIPSVTRSLRPILGGVVLLLLIVGVQLLPIPAGLEKAISPSTFRLYQIALPGWPDRAPYSWVLEKRMSKDTEAAANLNAGAESAESIPFTVRPTDSSKKLSERGGTVRLPISIAPDLTKIALLKLLGYVALGLLIVFYPFETEERCHERSLYQVFARVLLATGLVLGFVGLLEEFFPNGKPLWIFSPYDFRGQTVWESRAFGPFASPDHYACFLAMLLPPALAGLMFPGMFGRVRERAAVPILAGVVAVIIISALLATASRGGLLNATVGVAVLGWLSSRLPPTQQLYLYRLKRRRVICAAGASGLLILAVCLTGSLNRSAAGSRLKAPFRDESIVARLVPAEDTLRMISDFPIFGIGMGAWPDLYRGYARPPWSPVFMNAVHNEYIQLFAETGGLGFVLVAGIIIGVVRRVRSKLLFLPTDQFAVVASFIASLSGLAAHAALDFPLRIPAIAVLATVLMACVVRAVFQEQPASKTRARFNQTWSFATVAISAVLVTVMWIVALQPQIPYPYDLGAPHTRERMVELLLSHPANPRIHLMLIGFMNADMPGDRAMEEMKTIVTLEPNNPVAHDMYLQLLARRGMNEAALSEMSKSVFYAPSTTDHFYLSPSWVPKLTEREREAIEKGLRKATSMRFEPAVTTFADYYEALQEFEKEGVLLIGNATATHNIEEQVHLLSRGGRAFAKAKDYERAVNALQQAIDLDPQDSEAYGYLSINVDVAKRQFKKARLVLNEGIKAGADPASLYLKLAEVNLAANDRNGEEEALKQAADLEPYNFQIIDKLGDVCLNDGDPAEAVLWLAKATRVNPDSAGAFFKLAQAEEAAYQFFAAGNDYTKALNLDPQNPEIRSGFYRFKQRLAANSQRN